jgi:hypothetical protein
MGPRRASLANESCVLSAAVSVGAIPGLSNSVEVNAHDPTIGAILVARAEPFRTFRSILLPTFAHQAVIAIENMHLFEPTDVVTRDERGATPADGDTRSSQSHVELARRSEAGVSDHVGPGSGLPSPSRSSRCTVAAFGVESTLGHGSTFQTEIPTRAEFRKGVQWASAFVGDQLAPRGVLGDLLSGRSKKPYRELTSAHI